MSNKKGNPSLNNPNHGPTRQRGKVSIGDRAYIVGRNSASHAIRTIIRNFYSNRPYDDKSLCTAVVVSRPVEGSKQTEGWMDNFWLWLRPQKPDAVKRYKIRVIDDPRHTFLPVPSKSNTVGTEMYPWVAHPGGTGPALKIGAVVTMQFNDRGLQNNTHPDIDMGVIVDVISNPEADQDLKDIFTDCVPPRPVKGGTKTSVGKACVGRAQSIPTRKFIDPPQIIAGTDRNKIVKIQNPVTGTDAVDAFMTGSGTPNPGLVVGRTSTGQDLTARQRFEDLYVTSPVGARKSTGTFHAGLDMVAPKDAPIYAALDGEIHYWKNDPTGYGHYVVIKHTAYLWGGQATDFYTLYAHMTDKDDTNSGSKKNGKVKAGQKIGTSGATGKNLSKNGGNGAHLHFEVLLDLTYDANSRAVNPMDFFWGENSGLTKRNP